MRTLLPLLVLLPTASAQDDFLEAFALAADRATALERLVPGTAQAYYFQCLERQHAGDLDAVDRLLRTWTRRLGRDDSIREIEHRQALLRAGADPELTYAYLIDQLALRFDQQAQVPGQEAALPSRLDPALLSVEGLSAQARREPGLGGFEDAALGGLAGGELDDQELHDLLLRLDRPDVPGLPELVARHLGSRHSSGFGSLAIHGELLLEQLDAVATLLPALRSDPAYVGAYLSRLEPSPDVQWREDPAARQAYLERLDAFTRGLDPVHNGLKAHVLAHRLRHDLAAGAPDKDRFLRWLRLPRRSPWCNPEYTRAHRESDLIGAAADASTELGAPRQEEWLLEQFLTYFFQREPSPAPYAPFVSEELLTRLFAETKILSGQGDVERWVALLDDPAYYEALQRRVELTFPVTQRTDFGADEPVAIELDVKNVDTLLVKVFEIDAFGWYRVMDREVDASIPLDGLVAGEEVTHTYGESSLLRVRRRFDLPSLTGPGVYVVEFIGGGVSSRAVVRKGRLQVRERRTAAGHAFSVFDEAGQPQPGATLWFGAREVAADEHGELLVPYSNEPGEKTLIVTSGARCSMERFEHAKESYGFTAGMLLDREALLAGNAARLLVRPQLTLAGEPIDLAVVEEPALEVIALRVDGVASNLDVPAVELRSDRELVQELQVPAGTVEVRARLKGRVTELTGDERRAVMTGWQSFALNGIERTHATACPLLGRDAAGWFLEVRGKNGEPRPGVALDVALDHRLFRRDVVTRLATDGDGRVRLGELAGVERLTCSGFGKVSGTWGLEPAAPALPMMVHGAVGQALSVPYHGRAAALTRAEVSLLELTGGAFVRDRFAHASLAGGYLHLRGLPAGDYDLLLRETGQRVGVRVTEGGVVDGWVQGAHRWLEAPERPGLQLGRLRVEGDELVIPVRGAGPDARVHVAAHRYLAPYDAVRRLDLSPGPGLGASWVVRPDSEYHSNRAISDEYRYVLERRYAETYPGNMLERPGLLLNPWAVDVWNSVIGIGGGAGGKFGGRFGGRNRALGAGARVRKQEAGAGVVPGEFAMLDFLPAPARLLANRRPVGGEVRVPLSELGSGQHLSVIAVDRDEVARAETTRELAPLVPRDRRLVDSLDPERHLIQERRIDFLAAGESAELSVEGDGDAEVFDSLRDVYRYYRGEDAAGHLAEFAFLLDWPSLTEQERRALYSEHACHEMHLFLARKDPEFFRRVVRPYLANKVHRTFLDRWLLEEDLSAYLEPWAFAQLNVMERVLLARRLPEAQDGVARHISDRVALAPTGPQDLAALFDRALARGGLDAGEDALEESLRLSEKRIDRLEQAAPRAAESDEEVLEEFEPETEEEPLLQDSEADRDARDLEKRSEVQPFDTPLDETRRHLEQHYWRSHRGADFLPVNEFWRDFARTAPGSPFVSSYFALAKGSVNEQLLALALLDLPFEDGEHPASARDGRVRLTAGGPLLLVRRDLAETRAGDGGSRLLLAQDLFRIDDRYRLVGGREVEAPVTGELIVGAPYACRVVVTNPTSLRHELELLLQIPAGSLPLAGGAATAGEPLVVGPYETVSLEYSFYFPGSGRFEHYPAHAAEGGALAAFAPARGLTVVGKPSTVDTTSWEHISQQASPDEVLQHLRTANLRGLDLSRVTWRMRDRGFYERTLEVLRARFEYHHGLWSFALHHRDERAAGEYLLHCERFLDQCGAALVSPLVEIDPVVRLDYEHVEFRPLVNERAHPFGGSRFVNNEGAAQQYRELLEVLARRPALDDLDWLSVTYYLLLQDRIGDALAAFAHVDVDTVDARVQVDYMRAYLDFFSDDHAIARGIAEAYVDHPVERWRARFRTVLAHLDEAEGRTADPTSVDPEGADAVVAAEPTLELALRGDRVALRHSGLEACEVRYYGMDVEFLFSTSPFVKQGGGAFAYVKPGRVDRLDLPPGGEDVDFVLPAEFARENVWVEVRGGGLVRREARYSNALTVRLLETKGQLKVTHAQTGAPLQEVYVKVYAQEGDQVRFHKDGYTDLRGRFDYASVSGRQGSRPERYALLVLSRDDGAAIREVEPPVR